MENLREKIRNLDWEELNIEQNISIPDFGLDLLTIHDNRATLYLLDRRQPEDGEVTFESSYNHLERIEFSTDFALENILTNNLKLRHYSKLNEVFDFNQNVDFPFIGQLQNRHFFL